MRHLLIGREAFGDGTLRLFYSDGTVVEHRPDGHAAIRRYSRNWWRHLLQLAGFACPGNGASFRLLGARR